MAVQYWFDLYPRDDPRDGTRLVRFTKLQSAEYRGEANGTGAGRFSIRGDDAEAQFIDPAGLQYVRVVRDDESTELVVGGFFLDNGDFEALTETGTRLLTFGGAGTLSYLQRAVMAPHTYVNAAGELSSGGLTAGTDPYDDTWRLSLQGLSIGATTDTLGAIAWRAVAEAMSWQGGAYTHKHGDGLTYIHTHTNDRTATALPDLVLNFDHTDDSDGTTWTADGGEFKAQINDNLLQVIKRLMEAGLYVSMDPDTFELSAWEADTHRRDRSGASWGASVIRFQAPTDGTVATGNIKSDAKRGIAAFIKRSLVWTGGLDVYAKSTGTADIPWEGGYYSDAEDVDALSQIGTTQIAARDDAGDTLRLRMKLAADPANGKYLPFEHVLLDDIATVHTGTGQWDYNEDTFPVAALTIALRQGGDWDAFVDLGSTYTSMAERRFQAQPVPHHSHLPNPQLCPPTIPGVPASCSLPAGQMTAIPTPNGGFETGLTTNWTFDQISGGVVGPAAGAWEGNYYYQINGAGWAQYKAFTGYTFLAGQKYVARVRGGGPAGVVLRFGYQPLAETDIGEVSFLGGGGVWPDHCVEWTPSTNRDGADVGVVAASESGLLSFGFDDVRVYTGGAAQNPLSGTSNRASRCDHIHHILSGRDPLATDDEDADLRVTTLWTNTTTGDSFVLVDATAGAAVWDAFGGGGGVSDHGALTGLPDDDHPQYDAFAFFIS